MGFMFLFLLTYGRIVASKEIFLPSDGIILKRKYCLIFLLIGSLIASCAYFIHIVYAFFSGKSDAAGLYRILVTLLVNFLAIAYATMELRYLKNPAPKTWFGMLFFIVSLIIGTGVAITCEHARPAKMRLLRQDVDNAKFVTNLSNKIKTYFDTMGELPEDIEKLVCAGILPQSDLTQHNGRPYTYLLNSDTSFSITTNFAMPYEEARRISYRSYTFINTIYEKGPYTTLTYEKGSHTTHYLVKKNKKEGGGSSLIIVVQQNVHAK